MTDTQSILFGYDKTEGIVAVEAFPNFIRLFRRINGDLLTEDHSFMRWLITTEKNQDINAQWTELDGSGCRYLAEFNDNSSYQNAKSWLRDSHTYHITLQGAEKQFLTRSGMTLYKGMAFDDIHRLQLDIETLGLTPHKPENAVILVSICDNRGYENLIEGDEPEILHKLVDCIQERDPDVIEGHNIYDFDLPYLAARAKYNGIRLGLGRDHSEISFGAKQSCAIGYYSRPFVSAHIHGREIIDTLLSVQRYDVSKAVMSSYGLKAVAKTLGISEDDRELIPGDMIASEWKNNPSRVKKYAMQDVFETRSLAEIICPAEFYLAQMVPDTYSHSATSGNGEKINLLFIREYLKSGFAIPEPSLPLPLPGGYTDVRKTGVIEDIVKCDVESLYPSIMLTQKIKPQNDILNIFLPALEELKRRRIDAKRKSKELTGSQQAYWDGLQSAFKIIINSFYGYLAGPFNFNDYKAAAQITTTGQTLVKKIVDELEKNGSTVIEIDTDGVYFKPPQNIDCYEKEAEYIKAIGSSLPEGINLVHDGRYKAMISLKIKNYVLATYDGRQVFRGSALRSRSDEKFGLEFISKSAEYLLSGRQELVKELYLNISKKIENGQLGINNFARRERITDKTFLSTNKKRLAQAAGKTKVGEYVLVYERSDGALALSTDYKNDEDKTYLLNKLYKFACRLREAFEPNFDSMFPKPASKSKKNKPGQQTLNLFD